MDDGAQDRGRGDGATESPPALDERDRILLDRLQRDGRASYAELGRACGLSAPAAAERVRRLEAAGVIAGYGARVDRARLGRPLTAFVRLRVSGEAYKRLRAALDDMPAVLACHGVTGEDGLILEVATASIAELDGLLSDLATYGQTASSIVLSTWLDARPVTPGP
ncbi:MAG: Lrp/AsnC family transcriptional regulator [Azospirillaceae bacterium]